MKRFLSIRTMIVTLSLLLASISVAAQERPFSASGNGTATFITDASGNIVGANVTSSGTGTHLGSWTSVGQIQFTPDPDNPTILHPSGAATFMAANGDKLEIVLENGNLDVTTGIATGTFRFVGGTGRFAGATGSTSVVVTQNLATGAFQLNTVGNIVY